MTPSATTWPGWRSSAGFTAEGGAALFGPALPGHDHQGKGCGCWPRPLPDRLHRHRDRRRDPAAGAPQAAPQGATILEGRPPGPRPRHGAKIQNILLLPGRPGEAPGRPSTPQRPLPPEVATTGKFQPYPGIELTEKAIQMGHLERGAFEDRIPDNIHWLSVLKFPDPRMVNEVNNLLNLFTFGTVLHLPAAPGLAPVPTAQRQAPPPHRQRDLAGHHPPPGPRGAARGPLAA